MTSTKAARIIVITGIIVILVLKTFIRPNWLYAPYWIKFFMGIAPNLLGSLLLPIGTLMFPERLWIFYREKMMVLFCGLSFIALVVNEYLQLIPIFLRTFDYWDLAASAIGLAVGYFYTVTMGIRVPKQQDVLPVLEKS